jgi:hypothetical protein
MTSEAVVNDPAGVVYRVSIAKEGRIFWSSRWVSKERAEIIRRKNQKLVDVNQWKHVVTIEVCVKR